MGPGDSSLVAAYSQDRRCSILILDRPLALFQRRRQTAQAISSTSGMDLSTGNGVSTTRMVRPGEGDTPAYRYPLRSHFLNGHPCWRGGGLYSTSQYHPRIRIQASFTRGGSDARVASTSVPTVPVMCWRPGFRLAQTFLPISQTRHWSLWGYCRSATLVSSRHYVSAEIQLFHHFYLGSGLGVAQRK